MAEPLTPGSITGKFLPLERSALERMTKAVDQAVILVANRAKVNASGTGKKRHGSHGGPKGHGGGPNVRTGRLRSSISFSKVKPGQAGQLEARAGTNVLYAKYLERGTRRMRPYPFLLPAFMDTRPEFVGLIHEEFVGWSGR